MLHFTAPSSSSLTQIIKSFFLELLLGMFTGHNEKQKKLSEMNEFTEFNTSHRKEWLPMWNKGEPVTPIGILVCNNQELCFLMVSYPKTHLFYES